MRELSDKLFLISLFLLILSFLIAGFGPTQAIKGDSEDEDEEPKTRLQKKIEKQDKRLASIWKSKLMWVSLAGILISVVISYL
ncbi:hypothetical protein [Gorillibacterium timonense]|uniref:hypothetical protein n=1 Tax=Gorillibacterium timonense TaxID=1689269 RepID=UPI00071DD3AA|nr:hypothetical protein [Gorillibacterium timonense]